MSPNAAVPAEAISVAAMSLSAIVLIWNLPSAGGTTFSAPLWWALASAVAIGGVELLLLLEQLDDARSALTRSVVRYLAAAGSFCPLMAVLGAKRPQDRAWQWIVLSLWAVLALPALHSLVLPAGRQIELAGPWRWFEIILVALGLSIYLPTRHWLAAVLAAAGQASLLSPAWFPAWVGAPAWSTAAGATLLATAIVAVSWPLRAGRDSTPNAATPRGLEKQQARWRAFRDCWGALWALRVMLRVNQTAELQRWPLRLRLSGFEALDAYEDSTAAEYRPQVDAALDAVLRRFERVDGVVDGAAAHL